MKIIVCGKHSIPLKFELAFEHEYTTSFVINIRGTVFKHAYTTSFVINIRGTVFVDVILSNLSNNKEDIFILVEFRQFSSLSLLEVIFIGKLQR